MTDEKPKRPIPRQRLFDMAPLKLNGEELRSRAGAAAYERHNVAVLKQRNANMEDALNTFYAREFHPGDTVASTTTPEGTSSKHPIAEEEFRFRVGRDPEMDDLERCNCPQAGQVGHMLCGWDGKSHLPRFLTFGRAPEQRLLPANTELGYTIPIADGTHIVYGYLKVPVLESALTALYTEIRERVIRETRGLPEYKVTKEVEWAYRKELTNRGWLKPEQDPIPDIKGVRFRESDSKNNSSEG